MKTLKEHNQDAAAVQAAHEAEKNGAGVACDKCNAEMFFASTSRNGHVKCSSCDNQGFMNQYEIPQTHTSGG